jgi:predicted ATPase
LGLGRVLVILDNFEQVVDHATDTVTRWLQRAPEAVFLVTSRRLLRISGEEVLYLAPLPVSEAVSLFFDRARAVQPGFTRTDKNEPVVTEIVERLDGMSLAIELAAARVRMLPAEKILQRLSQRFKLLRGQRRDQSARQATLRGAIDWSWELLEPCEQSALSQLSMFRGGCTLEAAEAVVNLDAFGEEPLVMDVVEALVDHSLLRRVEPYSGHVRYRMLESIREYSAEKLDIEMAPTALRHAQHFSSFGDEAYAYSLETHGGVERRKGMALELENLLGGVDAGLAAGEPEVAAGCALAGAEVFIMHGPYADGVALLERVSGQVLDRGTQGRLIQKAGYLLGFAGRSTEALEHFQEALSRHREVGNRLVEGSTLRNLGNLHREQGRTSEALEHYQKALVIAREVGNKRGEGVALGSLGNLHKAQGRILEALEHYQQAVAIFRGVGDGRGEGVNIGNLGDLLSSQGDLVNGGTHLRDAIAICDETWPSAAGAFRGSLALILAQQGDFGEARSLVEQGEPQVRDVYKLEFGKLLCKKSQVESLAGDSTAAASALAEAEAIATEVMADPGSELGVALAEARVAQGHG